jgi:hypothetical protein
MNAVQIAGKQRLWVWSEAVLSIEKIGKIQRRVAFCEKKNRKENRFFVSVFTKEDIRF